MKPKSEWERRSIRVLRNEIEDLQRRLNESLSEEHALRLKFDACQQLSRIKDDRLANNARHLKQLAPPTVTRRVVRTLVYEGDPVWIAQTLTKSMADGGNRLTDHAVITVTTTEDVTTRIRPVAEPVLNERGPYRG